MPTPQAVGSVPCNCVHALLTGQAGARRDDPVGWTCLIVDCRCGCACAQGSGSSSPAGGAGGRGGLAQIGVLLCSRYRGHHKGSHRG